MERNKEDKLNLVRQILRSPIFHSRSLQEKQQILNQIIATGEVSQQDVLNLIQEEQQRLQATNHYSYLENLPYDVFIKLIDAGNINGRDLVNLCDTSKKLRNYCLKDRQYTDRNGRIYKTDTEYVYRKFLEKSGLQILLDMTPSQSFKRYASAYNLALYDRDNPQDGIEHLYKKLYIKQISTQPGYTHVLDIFGNITTITNSSAMRNMYGNRPVHPGLKGKIILQMCSGATTNAFYDNKGNIFLVKNNIMAEILTELPRPILAENQIKTSFPKIKSMRIIDQSETGGDLYILDVDSNLYRYEIKTSYLFLIETDVKCFCTYNNSTENASIIYLVGIKHSNEIFTVSPKTIIRIRIPNVIPVKVISMLYNILILTKDKKVYIASRSYYYSMAERKPKEQIDLEKDIVKISTNDIIDIAYSSGNRAFLLDSSGELFTVYISKIPADQYLRIEHILHLDNAVKVSVAGSHINLLTKIF